MSFTASSARRAQVAPLLLLSLLLNCSVPVPVSASAILADLTPTPTPPLPAPTSAYVGGVSHGQLFRRQQDCPGGTNMCSGEGFGAVCCESSQRCELDDSNELACCPSGAVCTGTAPSSPGPAPTEATSFVPNSYFLFPYIATSMEQDECSSAVSQCSENYDTCVTELGGGDGNGNNDDDDDDDDDHQVTIVVPGAGNSGEDETTIVANHHPDVGTSATPICSSLSSEACHEIETSHCDEPTTINGVVIESDSAAAAVVAPGLAGVSGGFVGAVVAGVGVGVVAVLGALS